MSDPMAAEFDTLAAWTADVALELGPEYYVPAGCRGSGSPAALDWLLAALMPDARTRMLDCGAGVGGPAGYARAHCGVRPVLLEPEAGACHASRRLFALPVVQADAADLPFPDRCFEAAWSLGVLCTTQDQLRLLQELRRVLVPGGLLGLLVFLATTTEVEGKPAGNTFPTEAAFSAMVRKAGLAVRDTAAVADLPDPEAEWQARTARVGEAVAARHGGEPALQTAQAQEAAIGHVFASGQVSGRWVSLQAGPA
jgi:SAM-dependent methyltransferase